MFFTYDGGLGDGVMFNQRALNLRSAQQMTRHIHAVISASGDPVVAFTIALTAWEPELDDNQLRPTNSSTQITGRPRFLSYVEYLYENSRYVETSNAFFAYSCDKTVIVWRNSSAKIRELKILGPERLRVRDFLIEIH